MELQMHTFLLYNTCLRVTSLPYAWVSRHAYGSPPYGGTMSPEHQRGLSLARPGVHHDHLHLFLPMDWNRCSFVAHTRHGVFIHMHFQWWAIHLFQWLMRTHIESGAGISILQPLHHLSIIRFGYLKWKCFWTARHGSSHRTFTHYPVINLVWTT